MPEPTLSGPGDVLAAVFHQHPDAMAVAREDGRLVQANEAFRRLTALRPDQAAPPDVFDLDLWPDPVDRFDLVRDLRRCGALGDLRTRIRIGAGEPRVLSVSLRSIHVGEERLIVLVARDITEQASIEEALRESEDRFRSIFMSAPAGLARAAPDGRFLEVNPAFCRMLGYEERELLALDFEAVTHPDDRDLTRERVRLLLSGADSHYQMAKRYVTKDGRVLHAVAAISLIRNADGAPSHFIGLVQDMTALRRAEEELHRSLEAIRERDGARRELLVELDRAKEDERNRIAADIHDDTVQAMTGVSLSLQILRSRGSPPDAHELVELEKMVQEALHRLRRLMFELSPVALATEGLASSLRASLEQMGTEAGIDYHLEDEVRGRGLGAETAGIAYRIAREALANVRNHSRASRVVVKVESVNRGVSVRVEDDGVGFDLEPGANPLPGHLGLRSMKERAEAAGGWWRIRSSPGAGTVVRFWIPTKEKGV